MPGITRFGKVTPSGQNVQGARFVGLEVGSNEAEVVGFVVGTEVVGFFVVGDTEVVGKYVGNPVVGEEVGFGSRLGLDVGWRVGRLVFTGFAVVGVDVVGVAVGEADSFEVVGVVVVRGVAVVGEEDGLEADGLDVVGDLLGVDVVGLEVGLEVVGVEVVGDLLGLEVIGDSVGVEVVGLDVGFNEVGKLVEVAVVGIEVGAVVTCICCFLIITIFTMWFFVVSITAHLPRQQLLDLLRLIHE